MSKKKNIMIKNSSLRLPGCSILLLIGLVISLASLIWMPYFFNQSISTFTVSSQIEKKFIEEFAKNANINDGLRLHVSSFYSSPTDTQAGELISFYVYNYTDEPILFEDIGFGLLFFTPDKSLDEWKEIKMVITPAKIKKSIGPQIKSYSATYNNSISVYYSYFEVNLPEEIRVYISGVGQISNKIYVAYTDLLRK